MKRPILALTVAAGLALAATAIGDAPETSPTPGPTAAPSYEQYDSTVRELVKKAESGELLDRGQAIVELQTAKDPDVNAFLESLYGNNAEPALIRTWAAAARINRTETLDELMKLAHLPGQYPAAQRPFEMRAEVMAGQVKDVDTALFAISRYPNLAPTLAPIVLAAKGNVLIAALLNGEDQQVRYQAASYLGAKANEVGADTIGATYVSAIRYRPAARDVPWAGGPLYIPGIQWPKKEARDVMRELVSWELYCQRQNKQAERQQAVNNLQFVGLQRAAGWSGSFYGDDLQILRAFGQAAGKPELEKVLKQQGVDDEPQYAELLESM